MRARKRTAGPTRQARRLRGGHRVVAVSQEAGESARRSLGRARKSRLLLVLALSALVVGVLVAFASATGPGGWDHLGDRGTAGTDSLNLVASALAVTPGGSTWAATSPTRAASPTRIASRRGTAATGARSARRRRRSPTGRLRHRRATAARSTPVATSRTREVTRTPTTSRSGTARAGSRSAIRPAGRPAVTGNVTSLQIIGQTLYVGGELPERRGHPVRRLPARLRPGLRRPRAPPSSTRPLLRLGVCADGRQQRHALRGRKVQQPGEHRRRRQRRVPALRGHLAAHGRGRRRRATARSRTFVRGLTAVGTDVYVGTDAIDVAASRRPITSRGGTGRGARSAPIPAARTVGSRRSPRSTP